MIAMHRKDRSTEKAALLVLFMITMEWDELKAMNTDARYERIKTMCNNNERLLFVVVGMMKCIFVEKSAEVER